MGRRESGGGPTICCDRFGSRGKGSSCKKREGSQVIIVGGGGSRGLVVRARSGRVATEEAGDQGDAQTQGLLAAAMEEAHDD